MYDLLNSVHATPEQHEWLARIEGVLSLIDADWRSSELEKKTSLSVISGLIDAGVPRMWISKSFGGHQVSLKTGIAVLAAIARRDASVAWQMGVQGAIGRLSDYLPDQAASRLFYDSKNLVVGSVNPTGRAEIEGDGYRLSGEWAFASGSYYADWLVCGAVVTDGGAIVKTASGPKVVMLFLPKQQCTIVETWDSLGLRATGSNHYRVDNRFVPLEYCVSASAMEHAPTSRDSRAYAIAYYDFGPLTSSSTAVGIAEDALITAKNVALAKTAAGATNPLSESHVVQDKIGRATATLLSAKLLLLNSADCANRFGEQGGNDLSALIRISAADIAERTRSVVNLACEIAGSTGIYATSRLDRCLRDIHTATKHITLSPTNFEMVGLYLLSGKLAMRR